MLPHPYSMSLAVPIFARPVGKATGDKSYHAVSGPQLLKNPAMGEFQIRQPPDRFSACAQDVDSMGDSQIRDIRVAVGKRADQVLEQIVRHPSDSTSTPSPSPPMRDNPFRSRRLFCSRNQGSPSGPCSDQTKLEDTFRRSVSECYRRDFCRLTRQFCNRFMAIHHNAWSALRCT
jgi:hypothetical protein